MSIRSLGTPRHHLLVTAISFFSNSAQSPGKSHTCKGVKLGETPMKKNLDNPITSLKAAVQITGLLCNEHFDFPGFTVSLQSHSSEEGWIFMCSCQFPELMQRLQYFVQRQIGTMIATPNDGQDLFCTESQNRRKRRRLARPAQSPISSIN